MIKSINGFVRASLGIILISSMAAFGGMGGCGSSGASGGSSGGSGTSGGSGESGATETEAGEASVEALSTIPSVDVSNIDFSQTSSASLSVLPALTSKEATVAAENEKKKGLGGGFTTVGSSCRACCEANSQKKEIIRHSQQAQLDRCYAEAMEKANLITIGSEAFALWKVVPPEEDAAEEQKRCEGIPAEDTEAIAACKAGDEGPGNCEMKIRLGRFGSELQIDMCECGALVSEATFGASGSKYTVDATRQGKHNGRVDKMNFTGTVDLGTTGTVDEGLTTLGDGNASLCGKMDGAFGNGNICFQADGPTSTNTIYGVFNGSFKDHRSGTTASFTGKMFSKMDKTNVCAKFSFSGPPPGMKCSDMIPFDLAAAQKENFLKTMGSQLGISLDKATCDKTNFCPNPDCDPNSNPDAAACRAPMVVAPATGCKKITHEGVECGSITNAKVSINGVGDLKQTFATVDPATVAFYKEVSAYDLTKLSAEAPTIAFTRNWDCSGDFKDVDFSSFTQEQMVTAEAELTTCFDLETKAHGNEGMGGHDCNEKQMGNAVNNMAKNGPPPMGKFAGNCKPSSNTCPAQAPVGTRIYFINPVDTDSNKYCLGGPGTCTDFTVVGKDATSLNISDPDGTKVTAIHYTQADTTKPATAAVIDITYAGAPCTVTCNIEQPSFDKPPEFDPKAAQQGQQFAQPGSPPPGGSGAPVSGPTQGPGAQQPGSAGYVPQACINAGLTSETACRQFCMDTHSCN